MNIPEIDPLFAVRTLAATPNPNQLVWLAMHQCYSEGAVYDDLINDKVPSERRCGELIVKHLLEGHKGHFGCFENPQITVNAINFPHSVMQQLRTHRVGVSFDVQSGRYTGQRIIDVRNLDKTVEEVFYLRPVGDYTDRQGKRYTYTEAMRSEDIEDCRNAANKYAYRVESLGFSEEHARGLIPFDFRQNFTLSLNSRSLQHMLDLRAKKDAQLECQWFCELLFRVFSEWMPELAQWYFHNRWAKARLSP